VNPAVAETKRFETRMNVGGGIVEFVCPVFLLPDVNPRRTPTVFQIKDLVPQRAETEQILQARPCLPAEAGAPDGACDDDSHSPARTMRLPTTFSAAKCSAAMSRAARQLAA